MRNEVMNMAAKDDDDDDDDGANLLIGQIHKPFSY